MADDNGIVVIPPGEAEAVYREARAYEDRSPHQRRWILGGGLLSELTGLTAEQIAARVAERDGPGEGVRPLRPSRSVQVRSGPRTRSPIGRSVPL